MSLISKTSTAKWSLRQKNFYINKGYQFSALGEEFEVKVEDLSPSSREKILVKCDYCEEIFESNVKKRNTLLNDSEIKKDSCSSCRGHKIAETRRFRKENNPNSDDGILIESSLRERMRKSGFDVLSYEKPLSSKSKIKIRCLKHKEFDATRTIQTIENDEFHTCSICRAEEAISQMIEEENSVFEERRITVVGFSLTSKDKRACLLKCECDKGHRFDGRFYHISKVGCPVCYSKVKVSKKRIYRSKEEILKLIKNPLIKVDFEKNEYYSYENIQISCSKHDCGEKRSVTVRKLITQNFNCKRCSDESITREGHYLWKGGVSPVQNHLRGDLGEWKQLSLKAHNNKCYVTGKKSNLIVHHVYPFAKIVDETLSILNLDYRPSIGAYTLSEQEKMVETNKSLHRKYGFGIPLKEDIHNLFHDVYGKRDTSMDDLIEFSKRFKEGEFSGRIPG